jgi:hypothetical protein
VARPNIDLHAKVCDLLTHTSPPLPQSASPFPHFEQAANVGHALINYLLAHINTEEVYDAVYQRHCAQLRRLVLADLLESFERFLKELAAVAIDLLAPYVADDRFDEFAPRAESVAAFVNANSIGRAVCESGTWLKSSTINERFRTLLREHFGANWEHLFPESNQQPATERRRAATLNILWQVRHNLAHNVGMITDSDAMKFRMLVKRPVASNCRLSPTAEDLRFAKRFLVETAKHTNQRVAARLGELLTAFIQADGGLFDAQEKANEVSRKLAVSVSIHGQAGQP